MYSGASLDANKLCNELNATCAVLGVAQHEATQVRDEKVAAEAKVQNLLIDATVTCDAAFPVQVVDDPVTAPEEHL